MDQRADVGDVYLERVSLADLTLGAPVGPPVARFRLGPASPNPFRQLVRMSLGLPAPARVEVGIYDVAGRRCRTLIRAEAWNAGSRAFEWDGRDDHGLIVAPGIYVLRARADSETAAVRLVRVR